MALPAVLGMVFSVTAYAQTSSGIFGTITIASGALVPGAGIPVTNTTTGVQTHSVTGPESTYRVEQLPPGTYNMGVVAQALHTQNLQSFQLLVDQRCDVEPSPVVSVLFHSGQRQAKE